MSDFYQLLEPVEHKDIYLRPVYWVGAVADDVLWLHNDGKVKDGMMHIGQPMTTCEFVTLDKAYLAINNYYVAHGQTAPYVRVAGEWMVCGGIYSGYGQTTTIVVDSDESQTMVFE